MKAKLAFFLALTFLSLLITPLVVHLVDDAKEVSSLFDKSEEENKNEELEKDIEIELRNVHQEIQFSDFYRSTKYTNSKKENYFLELSKINTPPPELKF